jgi:radical SAM superfamily enzyme YgiQ (UPF0313 family)/SAM-dependent methyltransferase
MGGPHVAAAAGPVMDHPEIDFAVAGEGEQTLLNLVEALETGGDPSGLAGVASRTQGEIRVNPPGPFIGDLDTLPFPAYDLVPDLAAYNPPPANYKKLPVMNVLTGRGCPNQCTFCDRSLFGRRLRQRSADNIADEIDMLVRRFGVREIAFVDENFTIRPRLIVDLFETLDRRGIRPAWTAMSRVDTVDRALLRFMRDHGCWHISFGIESGDLNILKRIKKKIDLDQAARVVADCRALGIRTKGFYIVGHPGETLETMEASIQSAFRMPLDDVVVTINTPLPGTDQYREAARYGRLAAADWSRFNMWTPVFVPHGLTAEILIEKHREFYRRFYLRPRPLVRYASSFLSPSGIRRALALAKGLPFLFPGKRAGGEGGPGGGERGGGRGPGESFRSYRARIEPVLRDLAGRYPPGALDEQAVPAYVGGWGASRWLFWRRLELVGRRIAGEEGRTALDFGCGTGVMLPFLAARFDRVWGIDPDLTAAHDFSAVWEHRFPGSLTPVRLSTAPPSDLAPGSVDLILALDSLEHVDDLDRTLMALEPLLTPAGRMIVCGPTENLLYRLGRRLVGFSGHYHRRTMYDILRTAGNRFHVRALDRLPWPWPLFLILELQKRGTP